MRQGSPAEEGKALLPARMRETWYQLQPLDAAIILILLCCYFLALENEKPFTSGLLLISNAK